MKNREFFELRVRINYGKSSVSLQVPFSVHEEFQSAIGGRSEESMAKLVEIFAELSDFDTTMQMTFQELIKNNADKIHSFDDLIKIQKTVRLCKAFDKWSNGGGI